MIQFFIRMKGRSNRPYNTRGFLLSEKKTSIRLNDNDVDVILTYPEIDDTDPDYYVEAIVNIPNLGEYRAVFYKDPNRDYSKSPVVWDDPYLQFVSDLSESSIKNALSFIISTNQLDMALEVLGNNNHISTSDKHIVTSCENTPFKTEKEKTVFNSLRTVIQLLKLNAPNKSDEFILREIYDSSKLIIEYLKKS